MTEAPRPIIETRYAQMFPTLEPAEIDRLRRFGETRTLRRGRPAGRDAARSARACSSS